MGSGKWLFDARERVQSVSLPWMFGFSNTIPDIRSIRNCGMILKLERLSHLSYRSFRLDSPIWLSLRIGG